MWPYAVYIVRLAYGLLVVRTGGLGVPITRSGYYCPVGSIPGIVQQWELVAIFQTQMIHGEAFVIYTPITWAVEVSTTSRGS